MRKLLFAALILASFSSSAEITSCRFEVGNISTCQPYPSTNDAPLLGPDGKVRSCAINAGSIGLCSSHYDGTIILKRSGGGYSECDVSYGEIKGCSTPTYTGSAIIDTSQE
ncbi:hypothetical protein D3Z09_23295 (plasmid) [Rahnella aquatilis]|jgi:hypothetical protein|nr:hypothetical protein D3Z09_23295 [Rahnella aquatilis]